ncbi:hypothetical protein PPYR_03124 [Photinus pyralis]|uniref:TIL domain-containing protein n=1 Tax=Photinus pyralis TaxID=7054 RepID=A0A1Y1KWK0_PHOPY|nr:uncharacterized protein LOC116161719 [Photinus pyralis]KAB0791324.1 hypothetical protein PPYR_03124 [Photinus pyralis]
MSRIVIVSVIVCLVQAILAEDCGPNAVHEEHVGCEPTCETPKITALCATAPQLGCKCLPHFVRDKSKNACVKVEDCPNKGCGDNESYIQTIGCEPTCAQPKVLPRCAAAPHMACRCHEGFVRDKTHNKCIKEHDCPK